MHNKIFLTIDFEDWSHDFKRNLGIEYSPNIMIDQILKSYQKINDFCINNLNSTKVTFFCTGILAKKYPQIINKIASDGHEIACHYFHHDNIYNHTPVSFNYNLLKAKEYLENASGFKISGFRAPNFSITNNFYNYYKVISEIFEYDSSYTLYHINEIHNFLNKYPDLKKLKFLPIIKHNILGAYPIKPGGTAFKFFPYFMIEQALKKAMRFNMSPIIYFHPYEFTENNSFVVTYSEMKNISKLKKIYWVLRQNQWHNGNGEILRKLNKLFDGKKYISGGKLNSINVI